MAPADARDNGTSPVGEGEGGGGAWPPAGFVDRLGAAAVLGVSTHTLKLLVHEGKLPPARPCVRPNGVRGVLYAVADLQRLRDERAAAAGALPAGHVGPAEAAAMLGVGLPGFTNWIRQGWLKYEGVWLGIPGGGKRRAYDVAALRAAHAAMVADRAARAAVPDGHVDVAGAAALFGVRPESLQTWVTAGVLTCGVWATSPNGRRTKVYPLAELERIRADLAARQALPEGVVDVEGACALFGVSKAAWQNWQEQGKLPEGTWWTGGMVGGRRRVYDVSELQATIGRGREKAGVWREGGRDGRYRVPEGRVTVREAAAMLGMPAGTIRRWDRERIIESGDLRSSDGRVIDGARPTGEARAGKHFVRTYAREEIERLVAEYGRYAPPYQDPQRPGAVRVPLWGRGIERPEAQVDEADLLLVAGRRWYVSRFDAADGARGSVGTSSVAGDAQLHHLVLGVPRSRDGCVGHRNGDPLDCRRANLVWRTLSERNAALPKVKLIRGEPPSSRFKGVTWSERDGVWRANVKRDGLTRRLGSFRDELAAAQAYDEAARELFGEHARVNFPDGVDARLVREAAAVEGEGATVDADAVEPARWRRTDLGLVA